MRITEYEGKVFIRRDGTEVTLQKFGDYLSENSNGLLYSHNESEQDGNLIAWGVHDPKDIVGVKDAE